MTTMLLPLHCALPATSGAMPPLVDAEFVVEHGPWMKRIAERILDDHATAEDAVQQALISAHLQSHQFQGRSSIRTWLYRITVNAALKVRRAGGSPVDSIEHLMPRFDKHECRIEPEWEQVVSPEDIAAQLELAHYVRRSIDRLPDMYRFCLILRDIEELAMADVAEVLGISISNAKIRSHRARQALKKMLEPLLRGQPLPQNDLRTVPLDAPSGPARWMQGAMLKWVPMMMTCRQLEDFIVDYLEDKLPAVKRRMFEFHIRTCRECRDYLVAYQASRKLALAVSVKDLEAVPEDLLKAVMATI